MESDDLGRRGSGRSSLECEYCGKEGTIYDIASGSSPASSSTSSAADADPNWICYPVGWFVSGGVCACSLVCARAIDADDAKHPSIADGIDSDENLDEEEDEEEDP